MKPPNTHVSPAHCQASLARNPTSCRCAASGLLATPWLGCQPVLPRRVCRDPCMLVQGEAAQLLLVDVRLRWLHVILRVLTHVLLACSRDVPACGWRERTLGCLVALRAPPPAPPPAPRRPSRPPAKIFLGDGHVPLRAKGAKVSLWRVVASVSTEQDRGRPSRQEPRETSRAGL